MPVQVIQKGKRKLYRWGDSGKLYRSRSKAEEQGRAIKASQNAKR